MIRIKLCGLKRVCDVEWANELAPEYIGFVFFKKSKRYVTPEEAKALKKKLDKSIKAVGVFVNEEPEEIAKLCNTGMIDMVQLHGDEDEEYIRNLRTLTDCPIIQAFQIANKGDISKANNSIADFVLLDSGGGSGNVFEWELLQGMKRPYFLAGGLTPENVAEAVNTFSPFGVDASSSLETEGGKDKKKMADFVRAVRLGKEG